MEIVEVLRDLLNEEIVIVHPQGVEKKPLLHELRELWRGAEAIVYKGKMLGMDVVIKWRFPKPYMPPEFDSVIRRRRIVDEVRASIKACTVGVPVALPLYADPDRGIVVFQFIEGDVLRDVANSMESETLCRVCRELGLYLGRLHKAGIVHGDYTTGNVLISNDRPYIIDFGLALFSERVDDHAIDVHIFFRSVESTHTEREEEMKRCFIEGYTAVRGDIAKIVFAKVEEIRKWGRYVAERKLRGVWSGT